MVNTFFDNHSHTWYSNIRLLDSINNPKLLIDKAIELGLSGIAITDHECVSAAMEVNQYAKELQKTHPDFTVALGNEIYLIDERASGAKNYHFILIAKDAVGHKQIRQLSSIAWYNTYFDRGLQRVPITKEELYQVVSLDPGHIIATTACLGGELGNLILTRENYRASYDNKNAQDVDTVIKNFLGYCKKIFKDDFYLEVAPSKSKEQIIANQAIAELSSLYNIKMCIGSDAHYLTKEDRYVHKAYLNSKNGEREVDSFYEYTHLMSAEEAGSNLSASFNDSEIEAIFNNSLDIKKKIQFFSLEHHQSVPEVEVTDYAKGCVPQDWTNKYPVLCELIWSDNIQERYWVNECIKALQEKELYYDERYLERLEEEARVKKVIGEKLDTCMFAYPNTLKHYIDLFWECGSTVGAGRGSACAGLNHYLLGITQLDPIEHDLPWWRYMNDERVELGDIDIDGAPSKMPTIFEAIRKERGELGLVQVATFGTESTKSAILTACRGYRSENYPSGIDVDDAQYLSSLVPSERGFLWPIHDVVYGNAEKDRKPVLSFINAVKQYPGLLQIIEKIEGTVNKRSSHASGVILFDEDKIYESAAIMRTPSGALITQWDLHKQEAAGSVKYDLN